MSARLTMMVSPIIVSREVRGDPPVCGGEQKISGGPLYQAEEILGLIEKSARITPTTRKCTADVAKLGLENQQDLAELVRDAVSCGRFIGAEWCKTSETGPWAACDAYELKRREWNENAHKELPVEYYVKFCIGSKGQVILLFSCHPPEAKWRSR